MTSTEFMAELSAEWGEDAALQAFEEKLNNPKVSVNELQSTIYDMEGMGFMNAASSARIELSEIVRDAEELAQSDEDTYKDMQYGN